MMDLHMDLDVLEPISSSDPGQHLHPVILGGNTRGLSCALRDVS